jgi:hypothetical protein
MEDEYMPKLVTVAANEIAVLLSNEKPTDILGPGRHMLWIDVWKKIEYFPTAQQHIDIANILVQLPQMASDLFKQMRTRVNFVAEAQIDITFFYEFAKDIDLFNTVNYAPRGAGNIADRIASSIRAEIIAKISSFAGQRTWNEALWTREKFQNDLNENIRKDENLIINQLKLNKCRVAITRLNLPPELKNIAKYHVEAEGRHIKVDTIEELMKRCKEDFDISKNTKNLVFLLATNGEDISGILNSSRVNFVIAPFIESLTDSIADGTEAQQEKDLKRFLRYAENNPKEVKKIIGLYQEKNG